MLLHKSEPAIKPASGVPFATWPAGNATSRRPALPPVNSPAAGTEKSQPLQFPGILTVPRESNPPHFCQELGAMRSRRPPVDRVHCMMSEFVQEGGYHFLFAVSLVIRKRQDDQFAVRLVIASLANEPW